MRIKTMDLKDNDTLFCVLVSPEISDCHEKIFESLLSYSFEEIINYICENANSLKEIQTNDIPQFSNFEDLHTVLRVVSGSPEAKMTREKLGYYLCPVYAKKAARVKYGENHYKLASQLGLANDGTPLSLTPLGNKLNSISDKEIRTQILARLIFRIPIIQQAFIEARTNRFNMMELLLQYLSKSTALRRRSSIKQLLRIIETSCENKVKPIVWNIVWEEQQNNEL